MKIAYYIYIFDYSSGNIFEIKVTEQMNKLQSSEEIISSHNLRLKDIYYMVSDQKLDIIKLY